MDITELCNRLDQIASTGLNPSNIDIDALKGEIDYYPAEVRDAIAPRLAKL